MVKCEKCGTDFKSEDSLKQHIEAKHSKAETKKTNKSKSPMKLVGIIVIIIIIIIVAGFFLLNPTKGNGDPVPGDPAVLEFAQCLSDSGAKMYGAHWCPACEGQLAMFGGNATNPNGAPYIECSPPNSRAQNETCRTAGIESYPTWEFANGQRITGAHSLDTLAQITGCTAP